MNKAYIGITGFTTAQEVQAALSAAPSCSSRRLMLGVLASRNTLHGREPRWPRRYPPVNEIASIFPDHPLAFNLVHYNSQEPESLCQQLLVLTRLGGPNLHGYQLNIPWPPAGELGKYRDKYPAMKLVLQVGEESLYTVDQSPRRLVEKLAREYTGLVDYILLDPSAGYGIPLNSRWAIPYLKAVQDANLGIGLGVAGGLSPATLDLVRPLATDFPGLSIDAESLLRDKNDDLDMDLARAYIGKALELFSGYGK